MDVFSVALSGLKAAEKKISVAAENTANARTADYKAKEVKQATATNGAVVSQVVEKNPATVKGINPQGEVEDQPNVSLEEEVVNAEIATYTFKANLQIIKREREMQQALIDIQA